MLLCALPERERVATTAITVSDDEGESLEEELAAPVAAALGVGHERIEAAAADYPRDWAERARRVEYQFVDHAWLVPLARRIGGSAAPTLDGYGLDTILAAGVRFYSLATIDATRPRDANLALFESLRQYGHAEQVLEERFVGPLVARARNQFLAATEPFEGHPSQVILSFYATRSLRGVSTYPSGLLGREARVIAPGASDPVVTAALSVSPLRKRGGHIYSAIFERLAPAVGRLPSTGDTARARPHLPRRWRSDHAIEAYRTLHADGPLASHVGPELQSWLNGPGRGELSGDTRMGLEAIAMFHAWWRRYRGDLREVDATELTRG
jgi:hypothetical protein